MAIHIWELYENQPLNDRFRTYKCSRCGKGPIQKDIFNDKDSLLEAAKKAGVSPDCNIEIAKKIMED
jgi:hypothetical protein